MIKKLLQSMFESAANLNRQNILDSIPNMPQGKLLDLGCDDGKWTMELARRMGTTSVFGLEIVAFRAQEAQRMGVNVTMGDLSTKLPFKDHEFDVIHANQVIEHVPDVDVFTAEIFRVLKPGGYVVVSTENGSSWHNIFASILGWQIFSLTNMSEKVQGVGNPMALHRGAANHLKSWTHKVIFNYRGLKEFFAAYSFESIGIRGSGYYPLPSWMGRIDPRHAHFVTLVGRKSDRI